ncbi:MAG: MBL fold metallo-hydrolase [Rickettsiales bacterium]|nr:MBL fold metallo-hydrolase [Rickettsiales bacterium]
MRVTLLGSGSSAGVPEVGCVCEVCRSDNPKNKRTRASLLIEVDGKNLLVDTSPDLRQQALREGFSRVDAVLYTHDHADHTGGIDDMRAFNVRADAPIPVYGDHATLELLKQRYAYAFLPKPERAWYRPCLVAHVLPEDAVFDFEVLGVKVTAFAQIHGKIKTFGYRVGNFAYSTDVEQLPETAFAALAGVDTWIVDCLRYSESYTHSNFQRTLEWIERVGPRLAILTHMAHDFDYTKLSSALPAGVVAGYDGIVAQI